MDTSGQVLDLHRFTVKAKRWPVGAAIGIWLLLLFVVIPEARKLLDGAEMLGAAATSGTPSASAGDAAYTKLYTTAHLGSISPASVAVGRPVHRGGDRRGTGKRRYQSVGRDAMERGWYVGFAALVVGAAVLSFSISRQPRHQMWWVLGLMPFAVGVPWLLLAGPYL
ncbi:hypothetical protein [Streptomyces sp. NPDC055287]